MSLGVGAGYAHAFGLPSPYGAALGADVSYGFAPGWDVRGTLSFSEHGALQAFGGWANAEVVYQIDIVSIVPWFGAGLCGGVLASRDGGTFGAFGGVLSLGFDYLISRTLAIGPYVRGAIHGVGFDSSPATLQAGVRVSFLWELL